MNRTAAATVAGLALLVAAPAVVADDVADLIATDQRMQRAFVDRDLAALEEILTDDYVLVLWNGVERRKREIDPTLSMLRDALMEQPGVPEDVHAQARMQQMHSFIELMTDWLDDVQKMDSETLASLMKMGSRVQKLLEVKDRMKQALGMGSEGGGDGQP